MFSRLSCGGSNSKTQRGREGEKSAKGQDGGRRFSCFIAGGDGGGVALRPDRDEDEFKDDIVKEAEVLRKHKDEEEDQEKVYEE